MNLNLQLFLGIILFLQRIPNENPLCDVYTLRAVKSIWCSCIQHWTKTTVSDETSGKGWLLVSVAWLHCGYVEWIKTHNPAITICVGGLVCFVLGDITISCRHCRFNFFTFYAWRIAFNSPSEINKVTVSLLYRCCRSLMTHWGVPYHSFCVSS